MCADIAFRLRAMRDAIVFATQLSKMIIYIDAIISIRVRGYTYGWLMRAYEVFLDAKNRRPAIYLGPRARRRR